MTVSETMVIARGNMCTSIMAAESTLPIANRFNPWGQCNEAAADSDDKAAVAYARATQYEGVEFVLLSDIGTI